MSKIETLCVQGGWQPKNGEPRVLPIYQSTTFKYESSNAMADLFDLKASGYFYTRLQNPTNDAVASKIAAMEGGVAAMLTSSGQAANRSSVSNARSWTRMRATRKSRRPSARTPSASLARRLQIRPARFWTSSALQTSPTSTACR